MVNKIMKASFFVVAFLVLFGVGVQSAHATYPFDKSMLLYQELDSNTNPEPDITGNGYTGAIGGATFSSSGGIVNSAYSFNGGSSVINIANYTSLYPGIGSYSISVWYYWTETCTTDYCSIDPIIITRDSVGGQPTQKGFAISTYYYGGSLYLGVQLSDGTNEVVSYRPVATRNQWNHVVLVRDKTAGTMRVYHNAVLVEDKTDTTGNINGFREQLRLGRTFTAAPDKYFQGKIDEVGIWNVALSARDVTRLYNSGNGLSYELGGPADIYYDEISDLMQDTSLAEHVDGYGTSATSASRLQVKRTLTQFRGDNQVRIPSSTIMTAKNASDEEVTADFTQMTLTTSTDTTGMPVTAVGALSYGFSDKKITLSEEVTVIIDVGEEYNGSTLDVYKKSVGGDWTSLTTCVVSSGACSFGTTGFSDFGAGEGGGGQGVPEFSTYMYILTIMTAFSFVYLNNKNKGLERFSS